MPAEPAATKCLPNLRQIGVAASLYSADNHNIMVPGGVPSAPDFIGDGSWDRLLYSLS